MTSLEMDLGTTYMRAGAQAKAVSHLEHALALREGSVGPDHPDIAIITSNLAMAYAHVSPEKARAMFDRALKLREKLYGAKSPMMMAPLDNYAEFLGRRGGEVRRRARAVRRAVAVRAGREVVRATRDRERPREARARRENYADAETWAQKSVDDYVAAGGAENPALWKPLTTLARAKLALGKTAEVKPLVERAIAIGEKASVPADELAPTRKLLTE